MNNLIARIHTGVSIPMVFVQFSFSNRKIVPFSLPWRPNETAAEAANRNNRGTPANKPWSRWRPCTPIICTTCYGGRVIGWLRRGRRSDGRGERRLFLCLPLYLLAAGRGRFPRGGSFREERCCVPGVGSGSDLALPRLL